MSFTTCWELLMASYSSAALLNVGDDGYIFLNLEMQSNSMQFQDCWNNDIIQSPSATVNVVLFVETLDKYGFIWFTLVFFRCHHCSYRHDVSREAPLCAVCIVTWNFSFELVLFCFVWTEAVRGPCINNCAAKTTTSCTEMGPAIQYNKVTLGMRQKYSSQNVMCVWYRRDEKRFIKFGLTLFKMGFDIYIYICHSDELSERPRGQTHL